MGHAASCTAADTLRCNYPSRCAEAEQAAFLRPQSLSEALRSPPSSASPLSPLAGLGRGCLLLPLPALLRRRAGRPGLPPLPARGGVGSRRSPPGSRAPALPLSRRGHDGPSPARGGVGSAAGSGAAPALPAASAPPRPRTPAGRGVVPAAGARAPAAGAELPPRGQARRRRMAARSVGAPSPPAGLPSRPAPRGAAAADARVRWVGRRRLSLLPFPARRRGAGPPRMPPATPPLLLPSRRAEGETWVS